MTTTRDIVIYAGEAFTLSLPYAGTAGRGQRAHIRTADATATVVQILTHNGATNARVLFDGTDALDLTIGGSVSAAWVVGANRVEWVYDIEDYDLSDADDVVITYRGKVIVYGNRTRESDVTPSDQMPSGDGRYVRFDGVQGLSAGQQLQARENIGAGTGGGGGSGDVVGPASSTDGRLALFDGTTGKLLEEGAVTGAAVASHIGSTSNPHSVTAAQAGADPAGTAAAAVVAHTGAADPHGDRSFATSAVSTHAALTTGVHGLGGASQLNVGTTAGTVAAGDDARLSDARTPTAHNQDASTITTGTLDAARLPAPGTTTLGGVKRNTGSAGQFVTGVDTDGSLLRDTPAGGGLTGFTAAENTSAPNATVPVASLTANNAATNVDAALRPKGTGALLAQVPDSAATAGNKRGTNAVDWQTARAAAAQVASGANAVISGGTTNTASGLNSAIGGGTSNTASGQASTVGGGNLNQATSTNAVVAGGTTNTSSGANSAILGGTSNTASGVASAVVGGEGNVAAGILSWCPGGQYGTARGIWGAGVYAAGRRSATGDRQTMVLPIACAARTDATATVMTSDAGAASATNQMVLPNNSSMFFEVDVVAHDSSLKSASWKVQGTIRRGANAASTAIVGTNVTTAFGSDLSGGSPGVTCTADTTNGALAVTFTGIAATTIYPSGHIRTVIAA